MGPVVTAQRLIELLQEHEPEMEVLCEVDGQATRTGDYLDAEFHVKTVYPVEYGGYEEGGRDGCREVIVLNTSW